jgi:hypothetical protein
MEEDLIAKVGEAGSRTTVRRVLAALVEKGWMSKESGYGKTKKAYGYRLTEAGVNDVTTLRNDSGQLIRHLFGTTTEGPPTPPQQPPANDVTALRTDGAGGEKEPPEMM